MTSVYAVLKVLGGDGSDYFLGGKKYFLWTDGRINNGPGMFAFPGGHIERGENALIAAKREFLEETGTSLDSMGAKYVRIFKVGNGVFVVFETTMNGALHVVQHHCEYGAADPEFSSLALVSGNELHRLVSFRPDVEKVVDVYLNKAKNRHHLHPWAYHIYLQDPVGIDGKRLREAIRARVIKRSMNDWFMTACYRLTRLHRLNHL